MRRLLHRCVKYKLQSVAACSVVCLCLFITTVSCAKMAELIEMCGLVEAQGTVCEVGAQIPHGKGQFGGISRPVLKYVI